MSATPYEISTPMRIGMILNMPLPQMLNTMTTASAINASSQLVDAFDIADGARLRPIHMMIGPVTTGGRNLMTRFTPTSLTISASIRYRSPATTIPPHAYGSFSPIGMSLNMPVLRSATVEKPPRNANEEPRNAGTLSLVHKWKNSVPRPAHTRVT